VAGEVDLDPGVGVEPADHVSIVVDLLAARIAGNVAGGTPSSRSICVIAVAK